MEDELQQARDMLATYKAAEKAILSGNQSYTLGGRQVRRADLDMIQAGRREWTQEVRRLECGGGGITIQFPDMA